MNKEKGWSWTHTKSGPAAKITPYLGQNKTKIHLWIHESEEKRDMNNLPKETRMKIVEEMDWNWGWKKELQADFSATNMLL